MPKTNKQAKVKLFKYKTALCQYYINNKECPFTDRCAFAHGEHELHNEENNIHKLNTIGKKRLNNFVDILGAFTSPVSTSSSSLGFSKPSATSLPSADNTASAALPDRFCSHPDGELLSNLRAGPDLHASRDNGSNPSRGGTPPVASVAAARCQQHFSSPCHREQLVVYRHNPYRACVQMIC